MSTQETAALVQSVNKMTETVAGKMGEIDKGVAEAFQQINSYISGAREEYGYINIFKNSLAKAKEEDGGFLIPVSTYGASDLIEIVPWEDLPSIVKASVPGKFRGDPEMTPNAIHIVFGSDVDPSYWLPSNPVGGRFSGGFGHVYVVSGSMSGYSAGEYGPRIEAIDRNASSWHIDLVYDAARGSEVYLFAPFVVAGYCRSADLVQFVPTQTTVLAGNIS